MSPSLREAIEGVYRAFSEVPRPQSIDGCPCCIEQKGVSVLLSKHLRELSPEDLTHYASSAFLTVGSLEDFLYLLPRVLEILASEPGWWPDPEVVTRAMHSAGFHCWPDYRRQPVLRYLDEVMADLLNTYESGRGLDSWICALGRLHLDLGPHLDRIAMHRPRLIEYYEVNSRRLMDGDLSNAFWDEAPAEQKQVVGWFRSDEIQRLIKTAYGLD